MVITGERECVRLQRDLLLDDDAVALPAPLSEPHGGRFDADDVKRCAVGGNRAARQPVARHKIFHLNMYTQTHGQFVSSLMAGR